MTLDEMVKKYEEIAEEHDMRAGFETDNPTYAMSESERRAYKESAEESRQIAGWLKDLQQLKAVVNEIKEELHTPNKGTGNYFISKRISTLERIEEIIDKYETKKEKTDIIEEKEDLDIEEER